MDTDSISRGEAVFAPLPQFSTLFATGADARAFLHAQLSNDVEHQADDTVRRAGYCSPKGRLLASLLVVARSDGFLLQVSSDIATALLKRLSMYVLRSKVKLTDASEAWVQYGVWGRDCGEILKSAGIQVPQVPMQMAEAGGQVVICLDTDRYLLLGPRSMASVLAGRFVQVAPEWWGLADIRAGVPLISLPTQDQFVPQMANFELIGGIDFRKGCYPGQEIVARSQYLGKLKRRMYRGETEASGSSAPVPGQDVFGPEPHAAGTIVNVAPRPQGGCEFLAVMQSAVVEGGGSIHLGTPDGPLARIATLPYTV